MFPLIHTLRKFINTSEVYKYLGINYSNDILHSSMKEKVSNLSCKGNIENRKYSKEN